MCKDCSNLVVSGVIPCSAFIFLSCLCNVIAASDAAWDKLLILFPTSTTSLKSKLYFLFSDFIVSSILPSSVFPIACSTLSIWFKTALTSSPLYFLQLVNVESINTFWEDVTPPVL